MFIHFLYLDPGSGSYLVQLIAAAALGVAFFFRTIKMYIRSFFQRNYAGTNALITSQSFAPIFPDRNTDSMSGLTQTGYKQYCFDIEISRIEPVAY